MKSIFSITRATYMNSGHISDFFKQYFDKYLVLAIQSHNTNRGEKTKLMVFSGNELEQEYEFYTPPLNPPVYFVPFYQIYFIFLVIRSLFIIRFKLKIVPDLCLSSFSLWILACRLLKPFGFCKKTLFWSWDYFPKARKNAYYWLLTFFEPFDKIAIRVCDYCWYASQTNLDKRIEIGQVKNSNDPKHRVVHWGTGGSLKEPIPANYLKTGILELVYFGSINFEKGLTLIVESLSELQKLTHSKFNITIIGGDTPYKILLRKEIANQKMQKYVDFKDFMTLDEFEDIAYDFDLGLAMFVPELDGDKNFTYYADPAKPRDYLAFGLPMIITKVPAIYKDIEKYNAGLVLDNFSTEAFIDVLEKYISDPRRYKEGAFNLAQVDRYDVYYKKQFDSLDLV